MANDGKKEKPRHKARKATPAISYVITEKKIEGEAREMVLPATSLFIPTRIKPTLKPEKKKRA
jgi:hypothetical protein